MEFDNAKAVLSLAERYNAKQLFKAAFAFMQENNIKLEMEDVVENPNLALAFMEESRVALAAMKGDLEMKEELVDHYRTEAQITRLMTYGGRDNFDEGNFDYDAEEWHVYDSLEEVEEDEEGVEHRKDSVEGQGDEKSEEVEDGQNGKKELAK